MGQKSRLRVLKFISLWTLLHKSRQKIRPKKANLLTALLLALSLAPRGTSTRATGDRPLPSLVYASTSASLVLSGVVAASHSVQVLSQGAQSGVRLEPGMREIELARLEEKNNADAPYTITISSTEKGSLRSADGREMAYQLIYNSRELSLRRTARIPMPHPQRTQVHVLKLSVPENIVSSSKLAEMPRSAGRAIASKTVEPQDAGLSDTITFSIAAN